MTVNYGNLLAYVAFKLVSVQRESVARLCPCGATQTEECVNMFDLSLYHLLASIYD